MVLLQSEPQHVWRKSNNLFIKKIPSFPAYEERQKTYFELELSQY